MALRLYDTARREIVPFDPPHTVRMYVCGITPYDSTHLGHAAQFLTYDLLIRRLEELGHEVRMVRNITDVDDSILPKARELGVPYLELAAAETARFHGDMAALEMRPPVAEPRATESVPRIIELVGRLLDSGHAYLSGGIGRTSTCRPSPTSASSRTTPKTAWSSSRGRAAATPTIRIGARRSTSCSGSRRCADEPAWRAPFGAGRPGLAHRVLGDGRCTSTAPTVDLHGGGTDLVFPHHECEIAQSESLTGEPLARHWLHSAMVSYEGEKMSKSLGNLVFVERLAEDHRPTRDPARAHCATTTGSGSSGTTPTSTKPSRCCTACSRRPSATDGPRPGAVRAAGARRDRRRPRRAPRARSARRPRERDPLRRHAIRAAPVVLRELGQLLGVDLRRPIARGR